MNRNDKVRRFLGVFAVVSLALLLSVSCSDNNSSTDPGGGSGGGGGGGGLDVTFTRYTALVQAIAPPEYTGGGGSYYKPLAPADSMINPDSIWWQGEHALLGKVFGEDEPFSLYRSIDELDEIVEQCDSMVSAGAGTYNMYEPQAGDSVTVTVEVESLTTKVPVPTQCQAVMGSDSLELDYYVGIEVDTYDVVQDIAFKVTDTDEWFYTFFTMPRMEESGGVESALNLCYRNHTTDSIDIKGVFFKHENNQADTIMWVYHIQTVNTDDFKYKMSWYSDESEEFKLLGCIIGGGDKDEEFVLRYRQYIPPDADEPSEEWQDDQVFGPNYVDAGEEFSQDYQTLYPLTDMYLYEDFPTGLLTSPIDPADAMSPWGP